MANLPQSSTARAVSCIRQIKKPQNEALRRHHIFREVSRGTDSNWSAYSLQGFIDRQDERDVRSALVSLIALLKETASQVDTGEMEVFRIERDKYISNRKTHTQPEILKRVGLKNAFWAEQAIPRLEELVREVTATSVTQ